MQDLAKPPGIPNLEALGARLLDKRLRPRVDLDRPRLWVHLKVLSVRQLSWEVRKTLFAIRN